MTAALHILGYKNVYHGYIVFGDIPGCRKLIQGMHAKFLGRRSCLTFNDFDWLFSQYAAMGGDLPLVALAEGLIEAYPEAKVVLVERDVDSWYQSLMQDMVPATWNPVNTILGIIDTSFMEVIMPFFRLGLEGLSGAESLDDVVAKIKDGYTEYYRRVRKVVPEVKLLILKLSDGWGPLCEFLEKPVPDEPSP